MLVTYILVFLFSSTCDHLDLHVLTHSFPTRRSSDLKGGYGNIAPYRVVEPGERFLIRRLLNPRDGAVDIGADAYAAALAQTIATPPKRRRESNEPPSQPSGPFLRTKRSPRTGLLLLDRKSTRLNSSH